VPQNATGSPPLRPSGFPPAPPTAPGVRVLLPHCDRAWFPLHSVPRPNPPAHPNRNRLTRFPVPPHTPSPRSPAPEPLQTGPVHLLATRRPARRHTVSSLRPHRKNSDSKKCLPFRPRPSHPRSRQRRAHIGLPQATRPPQIARRDSKTRLFPATLPPKLSPLLAA